MKKIVQRSCQRTWLEQWLWLYYSEGKDALYCSICINALKSKKWEKVEEILLLLLMGFPTGRMAQLALKSMKAWKSQGSSAGNDCNTINLP